MNEQLRKHVDILFAAAPKTEKTAEIKEELLTNLNDKYNDLLANGYDSTAAFHVALSGIGDIDELLKECGEVGNRPPGDCVGDSRQEAHASDSSAEYRTLPPGGRQPTFPKPSRLPILLALAFGLIVLAPGIVPLCALRHTSHYSAGFGIFCIFFCWGIAATILVYAIASWFARGSRRRAEEDYYRQMLAQGVQQGFSQEFVQDELRRIGRVNKLRQAVLVLVIVLLSLFICSFAFNVPRIFPDGQFWSFFDIVTAHR